jgi:hypothetical protein
MATDLVVHELIAELSPPAHPKMSLPLILVSLLLSGTKAVPRPVCQSIDAGFNVNLVSERAVELSTHSWEFGTASEALLELYNPEFSVFGANPFPGDKLPTPNADIASLAFAQQHICTDCPILVDGDGKLGSNLAPRRAMLSHGRRRR